MKLYGYAESYQSNDLRAPDALAEVTLMATPAELRQIAQFLLAGAASMEKMGAKYSHEHLSDQDPSFETSPQLVISVPPDDAV